MAIPSAEKIVELMLVPKCKYESIKALRCPIQHFTDPFSDGHIPGLLKNTAHVWHQKKTSNQLLNNVQSLAELAEKSV